MPYEFLELKKNRGKAQVTLNRPEVFNALNNQLIDEIASVFRDLANDKNIRVIVLTNAGDKAFCSGADLKQDFSKSSNNLGENLEAHYNPMIKAIREIPKPVICQMNGLAAGAGMSLALACDIILARNDTYMTELFVGIGLMPDAGSMFFLPRIVGAHKAFELFSTGRRISMDEAHALGIVNEIVEPNLLQSRVDELCHYYLKAPTVAIGEMKKLLNHSFNSNLDEVLYLEAEGQTVCGQTNDFKEGVQAFIEKRLPDFSGN